MNIGQNTWQTKTIKEFSEHYLNNEGIKLTNFLDNVQLKIVWEETGVTDLVEVKFQVLKDELHTVEEIYCKAKILGEICIRPKILVGGMSYRDHTGTFLLGRVVNGPFPSPRWHPDNLFVVSCAQVPEIKNFSEFRSSILLSLDRMLNALK